MPAGSTTIDFGAHPGATDASVLVDGQAAIVSGSLVEAWLMPTTGTADHSVDEHLIEGPRVYACDLVDGVGFTIRAQAVDGRAYGQWRVGWVWHTP